MKYRLAIVIILAVILVAGSILQEIYVGKIFEEFTDRAEAILNYDGSDYTMEEAEDLQKWWTKKHKYLELFLPHLQLTEIEIVLGELIGAISSGDNESATALLNRLKETGNALQEMFTVRLGNII